MSKRHNHTSMRCIPLSVEPKALAEGVLKNVLGRDHIDIRVSRLPSNNAAHEVRLSRVKPFDLELNGRESASTDRELKFFDLPILHDEIAVNVDPDIGPSVDAPRNWYAGTSSIKGAVLGFGRVVAHSFSLFVETSAKTLPDLASASWCDPNRLQNLLSFFENNILVKPFIVPKQGISSICNVFTSQYTPLAAPSISADPAMNNTQFGFNL